MLSLARHRIETDRLVLRPLVDADAERLALIANHIEIARNLATMPHPYGIAEARDFIAKVMARTEGTFGIVLKQEGEIIGVAGYGPTERTGEMDFGYWLGLDYQRQGYATEAAHAVLTHAFCIGRLDDIATDCRIDNPASRRVLEKLGFHSAGPGELYSLGANATVPTEKVALSCDDWLATKACA